MRRRSNGDMNFSCSIYISFVKRFWNKLWYIERIVTAITHTHTHILWCGWRWAMIGGGSIVRHLHSVFSGFFFRVSHSFASHRRYYHYILWITTCSAPYFLAGIHSPLFVRMHIISFIYIIIWSRERRVNLNETGTTATPTITQHKWRKRRKYKKKNEREIERRKKAEWNRWVRHQMVPTAHFAIISSVVLCASVAACSHSFRVCVCVCAGVWSLSLIDSKMCSVFLIRQRANANLRERSRNIRWHIARFICMWFFHFFISPNIFFFFAAFFTDSNRWPMLCVVVGSMLRCGFFADETDNRFW